MEDKNIMLSKAKTFFKLAEEEKREYTSIFNRILSFVSPSYKIEDTKKNGISFNDIEPDISLSILQAVNFIMNSIISRENKFAEIEVDKILYDQVNKTSGKNSDKAISDINKLYEKATDSVYGYLSGSNYYNETVKAIWEAIVLGTGAFHITPTGNNLKPFSFRYVPLNNLFYWEDAFGRPNIVFKRYYEQTLENITSKYKEMEEFSIDGFKEEEGTVVKIDIIESSFPVFDEKGTMSFINIVSDEKFEKIIGYEEVKYPSIVVFRFEQISEQLMGSGLGIKALKSFEDLKKHKKSREDEIKRDLKPPLKVVGNKKLKNNISLDSGAINDGGTGISDPLTGEPDGFDISEILKSKSILEINRDIEEAKLSIKEVFMSSPIGGVANFKDRSATEVNARMMEFRQRWSATFQSLQQELLEPMFMIPLRILIDKGHIKLDESKTKGFDITKFKYVNKLSKAGDVEEIQRVYQAIQMSANASQIAVTAGLSIDKTQNKILDKLGVGIDLRLTDEEKAEIVKQQQQQAMAMQHQQQQINNNGGN